jgi:DNA-directed RNA polymerase subunit RPC12/RpoP
MSISYPYIYTQLQCVRCGRWFDRNDYDNYGCGNCGKRIKWKNEDDY